MATLHVRNLPDTLHRRILGLAESDHSSLSAEVVNLLDRAVSEREIRLRQEQTLARIRQRRFKPAKGAPSTLALLREDRNR